MGQTGGLGTSGGMNVAQGQACREKCLENDRKTPPTYDITNLDSMKRLVLARTVGKLKDAFFKEFGKQKRRGDLKL